MPKGAMMSGPPVPYLAVFRVSMKAPTSPLLVIEDSDFLVTFESGPVEFAVAVPIVSQKPPGAAMRIGLRQVQFPEDCYLVVKSSIIPPNPRASANLTSLRTAELASVIDLRFPRLLSQRLFEGATSDPSNMMLLPEDPMTLTAQPIRNPADVVDAIQRDFVIVDALGDPSRQRLRLASRWYQQGLEARSRIDKFLAWWITLEVFPGEGDTDVVGKVTDLLSSILTNMGSSVIKDRTGIGRIAGLRADIVHQGMAFVPESREEEFDRRLKNLNAIVRTCLRVLGELPIDGELESLMSEGT